MAFWPGELPVSSTSPRGPVEPYGEVGTDAPQNLHVRNSAALSLTEDRGLAIYSSGCVKRTELVKEYSWTKCPGKGVEAPLPGSLPRGFALDLT